MAVEDLNTMEQEIEKLTGHLGNLVNNNVANLKNDSTLQLSQQLDILIVNYMKANWQGV